ETLRTKTHFQVLGIERAATEAQVKEAYFGLAKRFHPDTHHAPNMADLRDKLEAVFIRLGEAYEVLRNPRSRGAYESDLASRSPRPVPPPPAPTAGPAPAVPPAAPPPAVDPAAAVQSLRRAPKYLAEEKYWGPSRRRRNRAASSRSSSADDDRRFPAAVPRLRARDPGGGRGRLGVRVWGRGVHGHRVLRGVLQAGRGGRRHAVPHLRAGDVSRGRVARRWALGVGLTLVPALPVRADVFILLTGDRITGKPVLEGKRN